MSAADTAGLKCIVAFRGAHSSGKDSAVTQVGAALNQVEVVASTNQNNTSKALAEGKAVLLSDTFATLDSLQPYAEMARAHDVPFVVVNLQSEADHTHSEVTSVIAANTWIGELYHEQLRNVAEQVTDVLYAAQNDKFKPKESLKRGDVVMAVAFPAEMPAHMLFLDTLDIKRYQVEQFAAGLVAAQWVGQGEQIERIADTTERDARKLAALSNALPTVYQNLRNASEEDLDQIRSGLGNMARRVGLDIDRGQFNPKAMWVERPGMVVNAQKVASGGWLYEVAPRWTHGKTELASLQSKYSSNRSAVVTWNRAKSEGLTATSSNRLISDGEAPGVYRFDQTSLVHESGVKGFTGINHLANKSPFAPFIKEAIANSKQNFQIDGNHWSSKEWANQARGSKAEKAGNEKYEQAQTKTEVAQVLVGPVGQTQGMPVDVGIAKAAGKLRYQVFLDENKTESIVVPSGVTSLRQLMLSQPDLIHKIIAGANAPLINEALRHCDAYAQSLLTATKEISVESVKQELVAFASFGTQAQLCLKKAGLLTNATKAGVYRCAEAALIVEKVAPTTGEISKKLTEIANVAVGQILEEHAKGAGSAIWRTHPEMPVLLTAASAEVKNLVLERAISDLACDPGNLRVVATGDTATDTFDTGFISASKALEEFSTLSELLGPDNCKIQAEAGPLTGDLVALAKDVARNRDKVQVASVRVH